MAIKVGENTQIEAARNASITQARDYLRRQLLSNSPDIPTIYTTVKNFVANKPELLQMVNNKLALAQLAYGWTVVSMNAGANNTDRARYLECILSVVGLLA